MKTSILFLIIAGLAIGALAAPKKGKKGKKGSYSSSESESIFESGSFAYEDTTPYVRPYGLGFGKE